MSHISKAQDAVQNISANNSDLISDIQLQFELIDFEAIEISHSEVVDDKNAKIDLSPDIEAEQQKPSSSDIEISSDSDDLRSMKSIRSAKSVRNPDTVDLTLKFPKLIDSSTYTFVYNSFLHNKIAKYTFSKSLISRIQNIAGFDMDPNFYSYIFLDEDLNKMLNSSKVALPPEVSKFLQYCFVQNTNLFLTPLLRDLVLT